MKNRPASRWRLGTVGTLVILGLALVMPGGAGAEQDSEVERLKAENERLKAELDELKSPTDEQKPDQREDRPPARESPPSNYYAPAPKLYQAPGTQTLQTQLSKLKVTHGSHANHWVSFRTERGSGTSPIVMELKTKFSGGIYRNRKSLSLSVDGAPVECNVTDYKSRAVTGGSPHKRIRKDNETVTVEIPATAFETIGRAGNVEGTFGRVRFVFSQDQLTELRALIRNVSG
jgi:hypothetical protein